MEDEELCPVCGAKGGKCREDALIGSGGVRIIRLTDERGPMYTLKEDTYVNADSTKVAKQGSVESAWLLGMAGDEISDETAARLGLVDEAPSGYAGLTVASLKAELEQRGLEIPDGKKADLAAALDADDAAKAEAGTKQAEGPDEA